MLWQNHQKFERKSDTLTIDRKQAILRSHAVAIYMIYGSVHIFTPILNSSRNIYFNEFYTGSCKQYLRRGRDLFEFQSDLKQKL